MKWNRGLWAGACLFLIVSGCSEDNTGSIKDAGAYSPIITGVSVDNEPAIRGAANGLTAIITNVNGYPVTYHWSAASGVLTDSTGPTASWNAPDSIGTYPVTLSITAHDDVSGENFFQTTTFQIFTDNSYTRWTVSPEVQFDPDPMPLGGVIFAQVRDATTGAADAYSQPMPGLSPTQLTTGFATLTSPSMRADGLQIAFAGKAPSSTRASIWLLPSTGGDPTTAIEAVVPTPAKPNLWVPRYARAANWLLYCSDSASSGGPRPWFQDAFNLLSPPEPVTVPNTFFGGAAFYQPAWGPDANGDGLPDSVVCPSYTFFGLSNQKARGLYKFPTRPPQDIANQWLADSSATELDWSADGQHIVYTKRNSGTGDRDIWIINAGSMDKATATRVTSGPADDSHPRFSPDGASIFFVSNRADHYGLNGIYNTERRGTNIWSVARFDQP